MSTRTRSQTDTADKVHENRVRRRLVRNGYILRKSRRRVGDGNEGGYRVIRGDEIIAGLNYELRLKEIEYMLHNGDLFLFGELENYLVRLARRNPWFRRRNGGYRHLIAFCSLHFFRSEANGKTYSGEKILCKRCQSDHFVKAGIVNDKQRYHCKTCGYHYTLHDFRQRDQSLTKA